MTTLTRGAEVAFVRSLHTCQFPESQSTEMFMEHTFLFSWVWLSIGTDLTVRASPLLGRGRSAMLRIASMLDTQIMSDMGMMLGLSCYVVG